MARYGPERDVAKAGLASRSRLCLLASTREKGTPGGARWGGGWQLYALSSPRLLSAEKLAYETHAAVLLNVPASTAASVPSWHQKPQSWLIASNAARSSSGAAHVHDMC